MATPLRTSDGSAPRISVLVYNTCANDVRVLKESATLRDAGARVRIQAVARTLTGHGPGLTQIGQNLDLERVPEFALDSLAPRLAPRIRSALGIGAAAPSTPAAPPDTAPAAPASTGSANAPWSPPSTPRTQSHAARLAAAARSGAAELARRAWGPASLASYWLRTARSATAFAPDIIHANDANTLVLAMWVSARTGAGIVYDSHELWRHRNVPAGRWLAPGADALIESVGIRAADAVITVSPSIATWLQQKYRLRAKPHLVRNVPVSSHAPRREDGRLRELAGLPADARVIAYGGGITTSRGIEETLAALAHMAPDVHFVMLGYGERVYIDSVLERARELGVAQRVHIVGPVLPHEVSRALADGDVAVVHIRPTCLSYRYALPNKLFEAIRAGLPVVAADLPDLRDVVDVLGVGVVVDSESPEALAAALDSVLEAGGTFRAAAVRAAEHLTWENESEQLLAAHREALDAKENR